MPNNIRETCLDLLHAAERLIFDALYLGDLHPPDTIPLDIYKELVIVGNKLHRIGQDLQDRPFEE